jgi:MYXO-CTERM domain-containing protein
VPRPDPNQPPKKEDLRMDIDTTKLRPVCSCGTGGELLVALGALALLVRRRQRRSTFKVD